MPEIILRDPSKYPLLTFIFRDHKGIIHNAIEMPVLFSFDENSFILEFEGWENIQDWKEKKSFIFGFQEHLKKSLSEVKTKFDSLFTKLNDEIFKFLGISQETYKLLSFSLNLNNLTISISCKNIIIPEGSSMLTYSLNDATEFDSLKLRLMSESNDNSDLVTLFIAFAIQFGKAYSPDIANMSLYQGS